MRPLFDPMDNALRNETGPVPEASRSMSSTHLPFIVLPLAATLLALAGCGGGGGGASNATGIVVAAGPEAAASATTAVRGTAQVPASTPAAARSVDVAALRSAVLQVLQDERARCGFSPLASDASLDDAAASHGAYLASAISNDTKGAHTQVPGTPGFTGESPTDRAKFAGYATGAVNEAFAHSSLSTGDDVVAGALWPTDRAAAHVKYLLSTVYHMAVLLSPRRDVGVGYAEQKGGSAFAQVTVMEFGTKAGVDNAAQSDLLTYPCEGTTVARAAFLPARETPNPMPGVGDGTVGTPLYLRAPAGKVLVLRNHRLSGPDGVAVATTVLDAANDPAQRLGAAQVFVLPRQALVKGAGYHATFDGTIDGNAFSRSFSFQPG